MLGFLLLLPVIIEPKIILHKTFIINPIVIVVKEEDDLNACEEFILEADIDPLFDIGG